MFRSSGDLPVPADDAAAFADRGLLHAGLGQQGVDPDSPVQIYSVDVETGALTLLQMLVVAEEPGRIVVTDAGSAGAMHMVSEESLLLTAHVLNADGAIGA